MILYKLENGHLILTIDKAQQRLLLQALLGDTGDKIDQFKDALLDILEDNL